MHLIKKLATSVALVASVIAGTALVSNGANASTVTYTFTNVGLSDGGLLNGTITTADYGGGNTGISSWNLTTSGGAQPSEFYSNTLNFNSISLTSFTQPTGFDFFAQAYNIELQLAFTGNLITGTGVSLLTGSPGPSWECFDSFNCPGGNAPYPNASDFAVRYVGAELVRAAVAETPLPSTWTMLIAGFAGLGFFAYRGTKKNSAALAAA